MGYYQVGKLHFLLFSGILFFVSDPQQESVEPQGRQEVKTDQTVTD